MLPVFPTAYLPPVSYVGMIVRSDTSLVEGHEHYIKKTLRNRCRIMGPNGTLNLSVPVDHENRWRTPIHELRIAEDDVWRRSHWKSIESAYAHSPYFEFYEDELRKVLFSDPKTLFELNMLTLQLAMKWLKMHPQLSTTTAFTPYSDSTTDYRSYWDGKITFSSKPYHQVFSDRFGFESDLSFIDLVFNTGPDALAYL